MRADPVKDVSTAEEVVKNKDPIPVEKSWKPRYDNWLDKARSVREVSDRPRRLLRSDPESRVEAWIE